MITIANRRTLLLISLVSLVSLLPVLPLGAQDASVHTLESRRAEITTAMGSASHWDAVRKEREAIAITATPDFLVHHRRVQAVELTPDERRALVAEGIAALPPAKAGTFVAATPAFELMKEKLAGYFQAYDEYQAAEIHQRVIGKVVEVLEKRELLGENIKPKAQEQVDKLLAHTLEQEVKYRGFLVDPEAKNHHKSNSIYWVLESAEKTEQHLDVLLRRAGLAPKTTWGQRFKALGSRIKKYARLTKIGATILPATARIFAYLYNPFRKEPDPAKVSNLLRFLSKSYRFASGMKVTVIGAEDLPKDRPVIYAFSHRSELEDAMVMMSVLPKEFSFLVAQRALPNFLNAKLIEEPSIINVGGTYKDENGNEKVVDAVEDGIKSLESGIDLAIFPEGTISSPQRETRPLRSGIDVIASSVYSEPLDVVAISIDDPANSYDEPNHPSLEGKTELTVRFSRPIDPLKFKTVPGGGADLLLDVMRAWWHRNLYRPDVDLMEAERSVESPGEVTGERQDRFESLYQE